jgi:hypothetical protein
MVKKAENIIVGISIGDLNGIGSEVILKTFEDTRMLELCTPVIFANVKIVSFLKKELIFEGKKLGTIAIEIGKKLLEAREVFIKSHNESFIEWYEQLGFNKDQVSIFTKRYQMSIEFPGQKERIVNFSDRMIIQLNKKNTPREIIEKVLRGEIKTTKEVIENRKNISSALEIFSQEIEEAEIVEDYNALSRRELEEIMGLLSQVEKINDFNKENFENLVNIKKILKEIK